MEKDDPDYIVDESQNGEPEIGSQRKQPKPKLNYDDILEHIGQLGRYQIKINLLMWLVSALSGINVVVFSFVGYTPNYRCRIPYCESIEDSSYSHSNGRVPEFVAKGIPQEYRSLGCIYSRPEGYDGNIKGDQESCADYLMALENAPEGKISNVSCAGSSDVPDDVVYDTSVVGNSVVTSYGLTCNSHYLTQIYASILMVGIFFGSLAFGYISDKYGRIAALLLGIATVCLSSIIGVFMPTVVGYGVFRFLSGFGGMGAFVSSFVLVIEYSGKDFATYLGIAFAIPFALGEALFGMEAYFVKDWQTLQGVALTPWIILVPILWFLVPESPRWLISVERYEDAIQVIEKVAEGNGKTIPKDMLAYKGKDKDEIKEKDVIADTSCADQHLEKPVLRDLFRPKLIGLRTLNMFYQWFAVTLVYYGLSYSSTDLAGDPYTNFCSSVAIEIPGYLFGLFVMECWGRRPILSFCQIISGVCCIIAGLLFEKIKDDDESGSSFVALQLLLSLVGKMLASATFQIIYLYTAEIYPTTIRNSALGACSCVARIGGVLSLLLKLLKDYVWKPAPMLVMGLASSLAGVLALSFPETVGSSLPDTISDCIHLGESNQGRGLCTCKLPENLNNLRRKRNETTEKD